MVGHGKNAPSSPGSVVNMDVAVGAAVDDALAQEKARKHRHNVLAYWIMTLLGAGMLFPWNAVVNAVGYFNHLYGRDSQFEFYVALAYICPQLPVVLAMVKVRVAAATQLPRQRFSHELTGWVCCLPNCRALCCALANSPFVHLCAPVVCVLLSLWLTVGRPCVVHAPHCVYVLLPSRGACPDPRHLPNH